MTIVDTVSVPVDVRPLNIKATLYKHRCLNVCVYSGHVVEPVLENIKIAKPVQCSEDIVMLITVDCSFDAKNSV